MKWVVLGAGLLALGGCQSRASNEPLSQPEFCARAFELLGRPGPTPEQKQALLERMRNSGCQGQPQPQRLIVN